MPTYGEKKKKDAIEAILPATRDAARRAAQEFRAHARRERRRVNHEIAANLRPGRATDVVDAYDDSAFDWEYTEDIEKRRTMWERRDADNLASLYRWAPAQVEGVRIEDRLSKMYSILPDNTIGRHAVGHLEYDENFHVDRPGDRLYRRYDPKERETERWIEYAEWHNRLVILCENGNLSRFNDMRLAYKQVKKNISHDDYQQRRRDGTLDTWNEYVFYDRGRESYVVVGYEFMPLLGRKDIPDFIAEAFQRFWRGPCDYDRMTQAIKELTM